MAALAIAVSVPAALGAASAPSVGGLEAQGAQLRSAAESARLELYALETELARGRRERRLRAKTDERNRP